MGSSSVKQHRIGAAARLSGVSAANIRHYEREGLLPPAAREHNGYRYYTDEDVHLLRLIRLARSLDMSLDEVRELIGLDETRPQDCRSASHTLAAHLQHVQARIAELQQLQKRLQSLLSACNGTSATCQIIEAMHQQADALDTETAPAPGARPRHV